MVPTSCKVFTPVQLAKAMVNALPASATASWLEPAVGEGVFLKALLEAGVRREQVTALEIEKRPRRNDHLALTLRGVDALVWLKRAGKKFERIIGNPPYVSLSNVSRVVQKSAMATVNPISGGQVPLGANLWFAFLCASINSLQQGGSFAFVLPASWDFADYANQFRRDLPSRFAKFVTFRSAKPLFPDVADGSVVIVGVGYGERHHYAGRIDCEDLEELCKALAEIGSATSNEHASYLTDESHAGLPLSNWLRIRLGGVTGDSKYFVLHELRRRQYELPLTSLVPIVCKSRHVGTPEVRLRDWEALRERGEPVWLFRPDLDNVMHDKATKRYLDLSVEKGGCVRDRYKIASRSPWYMTPLPDQIDGFISGMSGGPPVITFNQMANLSATNTLYVVNFQKNVDVETRTRVALALLSKSCQKQLEAKSRVYAAGLRKFEPGDLASVRIRLPRKQKDVLSMYREAVAAVACGEHNAVADDIERILLRRPS